MDIIYGGAGNDTLTGGSGSDTFVIRKGEGSDTITDFAAGTGGDLLRLQGYGFTSFASFIAAATQTGSNTVIALASGETLTLQNVTLASLTSANLELDQPLPTSGAPTSWLSIGTQGGTLNGTSANDQLAGSVANVTLVGGSGDDTYIVYDPSNTVVEAAGGGIDTVKTYGAHGYSLESAPNVENLTLLGTYGSTALGNDLANILTGNTANNRLDGGAGNDVLIGGGGNDLFVIKQGEGSDVITDFTAGTGGDKVALSGYAFTNFASIQAALHQVGADAVLDLGDGTTLSFRNTWTGSLTAANFSLPIDTSAMVQTFSDDFETFDAYTGTSGTWRTSYEWWGDGAYTLAQNAEQQIYVDANFKGLTGVESDTALGYNPFTIEDGKLVITAAAIGDSASAATKDYEYTSGVITTEATFAQTYGYFEITAELSGDSGTWPAFWLLPVDNSWPPEIDVLESYGDTDEVHSAVISSDGNQTGDSYVQVGSLEGMHTYGMLWTPYTITFYVDGVETMTIATPTDMNSPMYMIANLAVSSLAGEADPDLVSQFTIDSIKAYQLPEYTLAGYTLLTTGTSQNYIQGTTGVETLTGTVKNDTINGRLGADTMVGGLGDDSYTVNDSNAVIVEKLGEGVDEVRASVSFVLADNVENLYLVGNNGNKNATGNELANIIVGNGGNNVITGMDGNDILTGGAGNDTFVFSRGDGSDIITDFQAGAGAGDVVKLNDYGFSTFEEVQAAMVQVGEDTYLKLDSFETLVFRNTDIASFSADDFALPAIPTESQTWIRANIGTSGADTMVGSASNERFEGKGGDDVYKGGVGDDTYLIDNSGQTIVENWREGIDTVESYISYTLGANVENLTLLSGGTTGTGNALANRITGSSGDDVLNGKGGQDWLHGGAGDDVFVFEAGLGSGIVDDFNGTASGGSEHDTLRFAGYGDGAYLTQDGDVWTVHYAGGEDTFQISGVTSLSAGDYVFV